MIFSLKSNQAIPHSIIAFFVLTYSISWMLWIPLALSSQGLLAIQISPFLGIVLGGMGPSLTAIILTVTESGDQGVRALFGHLLRWRVSIRWYLFVLLAPAVIIISAMILHAGFNHIAFQLPTIGDWRVVLLTFMITFVFGGPLGEEMGWRGYALPRLLINGGTLWASLMVGIFWGLWHLPLFWIRGSLQANLPVMWFMVSILAESILYTWVYKHTNHSLLLMCLFHTSINAWAKLILLPVLTNDLQPLLLTFGLELIVAIIVMVGRDSIRLPQGKRG